MSEAEFTNGLKRDAVAPVEDRNYPVREVAERLGVSTMNQLEHNRYCRLVVEQINLGKHGAVHRAICRNIDVRPARPGRQEFGFHPLSFVLARHLTRSVTENWRVANAETK